MTMMVVGDTTIHYEVAGNGPPLLFLHGLGSSTADWERQVPHFSETHEVITLDFPGHGMSDIPPGPYTIKGLSDDVALFIEKLGRHPLKVVGISLGGMVGFQLAADHPELVERLVVVNAVQAFRLETVAQRMQIPVRRLIVRFMGMRKMGEVLSRRLFPDEDLETERTVLIERWAKNDKRAYLDTLWAISHWEGVEEEIAGFDRPIRVLSSDMDYMPTDVKRPYVEAMPTATMKVIDNAHHAAPMERPERFNQMLDTALVD
ncbi:MAG: alpha/beta hydrolase [Acidimicrobiia bacterium]